MKFQAWRRGAILRKNAQHSLQYLDDTHNIKREHREDRDVCSELQSLFRVCSEFIQSLSHWIGEDQQHLCPNKASLLYARTDDRLETLTES